MKSLFSLFLIFLMTSVGISEDPKELAKLKETYQREMARVITPVDEKYVAALEHLQKQLAAANKLDEALMVRNAIEKVEAGQPGASSAAKRDQKKEAVSLRSWTGDGTLTKEDGEDVLRIESDLVESMRVEQTFGVRDFPEGMRLHVYYRTSDYVGTGLKLKAYFNSENDFLFRIIPLIDDGDWHEYVWNYNPEKYRGATSIRMQLELLGGEGTVEFKGLKVTSL